MEKIIVVSEKGINLIHDTDGLSALLANIFAGEIVSIPINYNDKDGWYFKYGGRTYRKFKTLKAAKSSLISLLEASLLEEK